MVVDTPQNALIRTTGIGRGMHITASYISPFKHSIASENPYFCYNDFFNKFAQTTNMNKENKKTLKRGALTAALEE